MIREPSVFLLDEPLHPLDPLSSIIFTDLLKKKLESGATVLLATHQLEKAEKLCDSFTIIDKGSVIANGTLQDRLVSELRLAGACTIDEANAMLEWFLPRFNARFGVPAAQEGSAYRSLEAGYDIESVLHV